MLQAERCGSQSKVRHKLISGLPIAAGLRSPLGLVNTSRCAAGYVTFAYDAESRAIFASLF